MKKIKVLVSSDENPFYYDFWNDVSYVWKNIFQIEPVLIYVSNRDNKSLSQEFGEVVRVPEEDGIPKYLQGQLARIYYTKLFQEDICMLSDIDMIPVSKKYFDKNKIINNTKDNSFFHLSPVRREFGQYPMCYYTGYGKTFNKLFDDFTWKQFLENVVDYNFNANKLGYSLPTHLKNNHLWFSDELYLFTKTKEKKINLIFNDSIIEERYRISREQILQADLKNNHTYIDCHMPRPFSLYSRQINYLINCIEGKTIE